MVRCFYITLFSLIGIFAFAEVPILNKSTVSIPKSNTLNKCIHTDGHIIYTQFECEPTAVKSDNVWIENANLTFVMPEKYTAFQQEGGVLTVWAKEEQRKNKDKTLEEMIEGKNFIELFNMGIQSYMQRAALLNSL